VERGAVRGDCLAQLHNAIFPARAKTSTTHSGVKHNNLNNETPVPPMGTCRLNGR